MGRLDHKIIIITGGCGDIGRHTGQRLVEEGAQVLLVDVLLSQDGEAVAAKIASPPTCRYARCDVTKRKEVDGLFASIPQIDVVISNAGIVRADRFVDIKEEDWHATLSVNLTGAFDVGQAAARKMMQQEPDPLGVRGRILFTGSWVQDMPWPGSGAYIASKGGQKMLAKVMAQELAADGIRVNLVAPGLVMAGLTKQLYDADPEFRLLASKAVPLGTFQSPENVGAAFAFLCSQDSDYMTGATLLIDGGCSLVRRE